MKNKLLTITLCLLFFQGWSQESHYFLNKNKKFEEAKEYMQKGKISLAYPLIRELESALSVADRSSNAAVFQEIQYYSIVCGLKLDEEGAALRAENFIDIEDNAARVQMMCFHLGGYYFREGNYPKTSEMLEKTGMENLSDEELLVQKFQLGYAYFKTGRNELALPLLNAVRQVPGLYQSDASYFGGQLLFAAGKYKEALQPLLFVEEHAVYGKRVPYQIAVVYNQTGNSGKSLDYAVSRLKKGNLTNEREMLQLAGHGYYSRNEFDKALPFLSKYVEMSEKVSRQDLFELSFCQYKATLWNKAIEGLRQLGGKEDSLGQYAMYLLGDAYLRTGQKSSARNAFLFCASNNSHLVQKEVALFNYAKLSAELGFQDQALGAFTDFLKEFPNSSYVEEAKELTALVLASTSNYKDALVLIEGLKSPSAETRKIYPRVLLGRSSELINDGLLLAANDLLAKAESLPENQSVLPFVQFWKGEIAFRMNKTDLAIQYLLDYLRSPLNNGEANAYNAKYTLGYCYLKKENFKIAIGFFEPLIGSIGIQSTTLAQDALLRTADCLYMGKDYKKAKTLYEKALQYSWSSSDYATFQLAMIAGITNTKDKLSLLASMSRKYPESPLLVDADMEIAGVYLSDEQYKEAMPFLKKVIASESASLKPRALLRLGIAFYNLDNNKEALIAYSNLLSNYPNAQEAEDALENARSIYVEEGRSSEYVAFARSMGKEVSPSQEEQLAYGEAEVQFNNGNFPAAALKYENYLQKFPEGKHLLEALYYKSEIYYNQKDWSKALTGYEQLADKAPHKFGEKAILLSARLNFFELKDYAKAEKYFSKLKDFAANQENRLEAMRGLLRSQFQLQKWSEAKLNATELIVEKGIGTDDKVLANLVIAKSELLAGNYGEAITSFKNVASVSKAAFGAEARYEIAHCLFLQGKLADAEKAAFDATNKSGSYEEWVLKSYLLLGDIYFRQKDYFNSKATFQSIIDNATIEVLRKEAESKLEEVKEAEKKTQKIIG